MIRNLVFDFGNVLIEFEPEKHLRAFVDTEEEALALRELIYLSKPWKDGDRGLVSREESIDRLCALYPEKRGLLTAIMRICSEWLVMPDCIPPLLEEARRAGYGLYYISNTNPDDYASMTARIPALGTLDGGIASFKEGVLKPDPEIFARFLERYGLRAEECLFIDDMPVNTAAAEGIGFHTLTLTSGAGTLPQALHAHAEIGMQLRGASL